MKKRAPLRSSFIVTFAGTASLSLAAGCGEIITNPPPPPVECPEVLPRTGDACDSSAVPSECSYQDPDCGSQFTATCGPGGQFEQWTRTYAGTCNPPPVLDCPETLPETGAACVGDGSCTYDDECGNPVTASCPSGAWEVQFGGICNPPAPCDAFTTAEACAQNPSCRWLIPGCGTNPLSVEGCFDAAPCLDSSQCGALTCTQVSTLPYCPGDGCSCDAPTAVCL